MKRKSCVECLKYASCLSIEGKISYILQQPMLLSVFVLCRIFGWSVGGDDTAVNDIVLPCMLNERILVVELNVIVFIVVCIDSSRA